MIINDYKKVALYPYNREYLAFVKYINRYHEKLQITDVVSPIGWGLRGKDAGAILNKPNMGIDVTDDIDKAVDNCDILLIAEYKSDDSLHKQVINTMMQAIENKKDIICTMHVSENELNDLRQKSLIYGVDFTNILKENHWSSVKHNLCINTSILYRTQAPVVYIGELVPGLDGTEVLLTVTDCFKNEGYKTVTIGGKSYNEILGIYSMPDFMYEASIGENDKIYHFNNYIRYLEENEKPDIFIIQLPGGMMKYNDRITSGFGTIPYLISQAIQGDYFILSTYINNINSEFFQSLSNLFFYRFGFGIDCIEISNAFVDTQDSDINGKLSLIYLEQSLVDKLVENNINESKIPICNINNSEGIARMSEHMLKTLTD